MMKLVLLVILFRVSIIELNAQYFPKAYPDSVLNRITYIKTILEENLIDSIGADSMNFLIRELKEYTDCLYYTTKWNLALEESDWDKRVFLFKEISLYPYYLIKNEELIKNAQVLYEGSIIRLIKEYKGNVDLLNSIHIHEGYRQLIYPTLKRAIESAGGKWDRGPIAPMHVKHLFKN